MMTFCRIIPLPVMMMTMMLLVAAKTSLALYRNIYVFDQLNRKVDIKNVLAEETTVGKLRQIIATFPGYEFDSLILCSNHKYPFLDDNKLISEYFENIPEVLVRVCDDLKTTGIINIYVDQIKLDFAVNKTNTVGWLKEKLLGKDRSVSYKVFFEGKELEDDIKTVGQYKLFEGATLGFVKNDVKIKVDVQMSDSRRYDILVGLQSTIKDLKGLIEEKGINFNSSILVHYNNPVYDNRKVISYSRLFYLGVSFRLVSRLADAGGVLEIFFRKIGFLQHFPVFVKTDNTIGDLKRYASKVDWSIPVRKMILKFGDEILEDDFRKLSEFNLYSGAPVYVERNNSESIDSTHQSNSNEQETSIDSELNQSDVMITNSATDMEATEGDECWICYENMIEGEGTILTKCGHKFHRQCLINWKNSGQCVDFICPDCRCILESAQIEPVTEV